MRTTHRSTEPACGRKATASTEDGAGGPLPSAMARGRSGRCECARRSNIARVAFASRDSAICGHFVLAEARRQASKGGTRGDEWLSWTRNDESIRSRAGEAESELRFVGPAQTLSHGSCTTRHRGHAATRSCATDSIRASTQPRAFMARICGSARNRRSRTRRRSATTYGSSNAPASHSSSAVPSRSSPESDGRRIRFRLTDYEANSEIVIVWRNRSSFPSAPPAGPRDPRRCSVKLACA